MVIVKFESEPASHGFYARVKLTSRPYGRGKLFTLEYAGWPYDKFKVFKSLEADSPESFLEIINFFKTPNCFEDHEWLTIISELAQRLRSIYMLK